MNARDIKKLLNGEGTGPVVYDMYQNDEFAFGQSDLNPLHEMSKYSGNGQLTNQATSPAGPADAGDSQGNLGIEFGKTIETLKNAYFIAYTQRIDEIEALEKANAAKKISDPNALDGDFEEITQITGIIPMVGNGPANELDPPPSGRSNPHIVGNRGAADVDVVEGEGTPIEYIREALIAALDPDPEVVGEGLDGINDAIVDICGTLEYFNPETSPQGASGDESGNGGGNGNTGGGNGNTGGGDGSSGDSGDDSSGDDGDSTDNTPAALKASKECLMAELALIEFLMVVITIVKVVLVIEQYVFSIIAPIIAIASELVAVWVNPAVVGDAAVKLAGTAVSFLITAAVEIVKALIDSLNLDCIIGGSIASLKALLSAFGEVKSAVNGPGDWISFATDDDKPIQQLSSKFKGLPGRIKKDIAGINLSDYGKQMVDNAKGQWDEQLTGFKALANKPKEVWANLDGTLNGTENAITGSITGLNNLDSYLEPGTLLSDGLTDKDITKDPGGAITDALTTILGTDPSADIKNLAMNKIDSIGSSATGAVTNALDVANIENALGDVGEQTETFVAVSDKTANKAKAFFKDGYEAF